MQLALGRLGGNPTNNELLAELIKLGSQPGSNGNVLNENGALRTRFLFSQHLFTTLIVSYASSSHFRLLFFFSVFALVPR